MTRNVVEQSSLAWASLGIAQTTRSSLRYRTVSGSKIVGYKWPPQGGLSSTRCILDEIY